MTKLEQHRQTWQGKSDEWLFERLANELTQKVEEIHKLLAENEQLRLSNVVGQSEQLKAFSDWLQSDTANLNYDFRDLVDEYLKSL